MSISWIDAMPETAFLSWLKNDAKSYSRYQIINTDYDDRGIQVLVDKKQLDIRYFFHGYHLLERFYGLSMPIKQLSQQVLNVVYRMDGHAFSTFFHMMLRCLKHVLVGVLTFMVLPVLMVYYIGYHQFYLGLIYAEDVGPEHWFNGLVYFLGQLTSALAILAIEFVRHALSLLLNSVMLVFNLPLVLVRWCYTCFWGNQLPDQSAAIKAQANYFLKEINCEIEKCLGPYISADVSPKEALARTLNDYFISINGCKAGEVGNMVVGTSPAQVDVIGDQLVLTESCSNKEFEEIINKANECYAKPSQFFDENEKVAHFVFKEEWGDLSSRKQELISIASPPKPGS
jgi:hypothetical protein